MNKIIRIKKCFTAFTLAEVLVTLGIIGVVAAMTLPAIIDNSRNKQLETAFKKSYSVLLQALDMYNAQEGVKLTPQNCKGRDFKPSLMKYILTTKDCGFSMNGAAERGCLPNTGGSYKNFVGTKAIGTGSIDDGQFVINDGSLILLESGSGELWITVDVNGYNKSPNRWGFDLFTFQINNEGTLLPMGAKGTHFEDITHNLCSPTNFINDSANGITCALRAINEKDYFKNLQR